MRPESLQFLERLVNTPSPTGNESRGQRVWLDYVKPFADETFSDAYGNTVAVLNKGGSPRLMLAAHADEIAMSVNFIDEKGFIYVRRTGGYSHAERSDPRRGGQRRAPPDENGGREEGPEDGGPVH
jgi:endoglucanase